MIGNMELYIDTSDNQNIKLSLLKEGILLCEKSEEAQYRQSEKLLPLIVSFLADNGLSKEELSSIRVNEQGEGFSSLRLGVVVANALAYGLGIEVIDSKGKNLKAGDISLVRPEYASEPNIGKKKS